MALVRKTTIKIDVSKLDKSRFRTYEKKDGTKVTEASVDFIELDKTKVITKSDGTPIQGDGWRLENVGFVVESQTKEERENKTDTQIVGNATRFVNVDENKSQESDTIEYPTDEISPDDIPF